MAKNKVRIATPAAMSAGPKTDTVISGSGSISPTKPASAAKSGTTITGEGDVNRSAPSTIESGGAMTSAARQNNDMQPVRSTLTRYGADNDRIGYNNGYVTLNGQNFMRPAENIDGTTYDTAENIDAAWRQYAAGNGLSGIRETLRNRGAESMLGWNDDTKSVTIGGIDAYTPKYNADGTTYADAETINRLTNLAYERGGDRLLGARAYMDSLGLPGSVIWDGESGTVNIGGMAIKPTYVADGIAYVPKSQLDAAAAAYRKQTGIRTPQGVLSDYEDKYGDRIDKALDAIEDREPYSFDPATDPLYRRYVTERQRQADEAYRQVLNGNNTSPYGASGAVLAEALSAKNRYLDDLAEDRERIEGAEYGRYTDDTARLRDNLNDILSAGNDYYGKLYQADADAYTRARAGAEDTNNAYQQAFENEQRLFENEQAAAANAAANAYTAAQTAYSGAQREGLDIENQMNRYNLDTYPEERRLYLDSMSEANRYNRARTIGGELENEQIMSYLGGGVVTDELTPNYAAVARALGYTPDANGIYTDANGNRFSSIDAQRIYEGLMNKDAYYAKLGLFYPNY